MLFSRSMLPALGLALLTSLAPAQERTRPDVAQFVPLDSYATIRFAGLRQGKISAVQHGLVQFFRRSLKGTFAELVLRETASSPDEWRDVLRQGLSEELGVDRKQLSAVLGGPGILSLGRITPVGEAVLPSMLLVIDVQGQEAAAKAILERIGAALLREVRGLEADQAKLGGHEFWRLWHRRFPGEIYATVEGGYLLAGLGRGYVQAALECLNGQRANITQRPEWSEAQRSNSPNLVQAHIDLRPVGHTLAPWLPYELEALTRALGIEAIEGLSLSSARSGNGDVTWASIRAPGKSEGLLKRAFAEPLRLHSAKLVPADAIYYGAVRIQTQGLEAAAREVLAALPVMAQKELQMAWQREILPGIRRELRNAGEMLPQLPLQEMLTMLRGLGSEFALAVLPMRPNQLQPSVLAFAECKDPARAAEQLSGLLDGIEGMRMRSLERHGTKVHYLSLQRLTGRPLTPGFAAIEGQLVLSSDRRALLDWLGAKAEGAKTLAELPSFVREHRACPQAAIMSFLNFEALHGIVTADFGDFMSGLTEIPESLRDALLDPELGKALGVQSDSLFADETGFHWRRRSSLGLGSVLMAASATLDWLLEDAKVY